MMQFKKVRFNIFIIIFLLGACSASDDPGLPSGGGGGNGGNQDGWLIPFERVFDGGPGKDGIPSIDNPKFTAVGEVTFLSDDELVIAVEYEREIVAYPHTILDWHEITNDKIGDLPLAITYCPLTGTTLAWERVIDSKETTFGVSGLLYNSNLIPYDRATDSNWSQILQQSVYGENKGKIAKQYPVVEMAWSTFRKAFPNAKVLNTDTGFSRAYGRYPYGDYKENNNRLIFPVDKKDDRVLQKERVLGVPKVDSEVKVYTFSALAENGGIIKDKVEGRDLLVVGNADENFIVVFESDGEEYEVVKDAFPIILKDVNGSLYDVFGRGKDKDLVEISSLMGYWFVFPAFYEAGVEVYGL